MLTDVNHKGTENAIQIHSAVWWSGFHEPFSNKDADPLAGGKSVQYSDLEYTENKSSFSYDRLWGTSVFTKVKKSYS